MATPYYGMIDEVRVMLVDNDKEFVTKMVDLLKPYKYKVTTVDMDTATTMLSTGKEKIDAMIINVHLPYCLHFKLLAQAVALDIVSLFTCDEHNERLVMDALNIGAYLYLKKSLGGDILEYLWQFVLRVRIKKEKTREGLEEYENKMNVDDIGNNIIAGDNEEQAGKKNNVPNTKEQSNNSHQAEDDVVSHEIYKLRKKRSRESIKEINEEESQSCTINNTVMRKDFITWTEDLHDKFVEAMQHLGEGRCFPKGILEVMNVPYLTRTHVSSHLQRCRNGTWKPPKGKTSRRHPSGQGSSSGSQQRCSIRKFGTMSHFQTNISNQVQRGLEFSSPTLNTNNIFARGESSIQQLYRPQLQVQPHFLSIANSFNNPFLSAQNNVGGELQQQHDPLFGMMESQGLQGSIIGNTDYKPELTFSGVDHHVQNDHNLNVNVVNVTTYSDSAMMPDTNVENATVDGLGATNANFQQYFSEQNMSDPSNIVAAPDTSDSNEKQNCGVHFNFDDVDFDINNMDQLFQNPYFNEQNMSDPSNIGTAPDAGDSNEKENCDVYFNFDDVDFDFDNMDFQLFQNLELSSSDLPNEQNSEFDRVHSDDQVTTIPSIQLQGIVNFPDESQHDPMLCENIGGNSQKGSLQ